ncbi:Hypothetical predicted protein [Cloeon dipterum]|uniref:Uncharacterized protein n=1 Tax=Cloeon dipterum TaxID=197152 RepID=A0A8S1CP69_9INSE|nr:Hypothetical predicted protein [Cloeon dipterum]
MCILESNCVRVVSSVLSDDFLWARDHNLSLLDFLQGIECVNLSLQMKPDCSQRWKGAKTSKCGESAPVHLQAC